MEVLKRESYQEAPISNWAWFSTPYSGHSVQRYGKGEDRKMGQVEGGVVEIPALRYYKIIYLYFTITLLLA